MPRVMFFVYIRHYLLYLLNQELTDFFCKGIDRKYFSLCGPYGLFCNYLALLLQCGSSRSQYVNIWVWVHFNTILFTKINNGLDLSQ